MRILLTLFFVLFSYVIFAQLIISGVVKNEEGNPISDANITISPSITDETLAFFITKSDGKYTLKIENPSHDTYEIKVRAMNYAFTSGLVNESAINFDFTLQEKAIELKEVKLKESPIRKKGDTIVYDVSNFKDIQDRSIADVIFYFKINNLCFDLIKIIINRTSFSYSRLYFSVFSIPCFRIDKLFSTEFPSFSI
ncbi:carboxypeptidase-like regulatory domain-containing protein [Empedobacter falsenii]|nr:carboxypeptidase regulatory-like domain-containing protein [Empedobacter falsenii]MBW1619066.1 carboxypeptidase-like regulatory domain-containing protein [Empedobacter falsenii]